MNYFKFKCLYILTKKTLIIIIKKVFLIIKINKNDNRIF